MYKLYIKRVLDLIIALLLLPIFLLIFFVIAILIKLDDGGPIFYSGERVGKGLHKYKMYKFRSMVVDAPDLRNVDGSTFNDKNDPRQTRVGNFLRKTSIDEIPQILNILNGTMSLVGPRPSPPGNSKIYSEEYKKKFSIKPGITGYTQAYFRNNADIIQKQNSDLFYVDNLSFKLDIKIIFKTIKTVLKKEGLYTKRVKSK